MASLYFHIPFCKKACHYCDFYFTTKSGLISVLVQSLKKEIVLRKEEIQKESIDSIYFGGGTPSLLSLLEIDSILNLIFKLFSVNKNPEITLEANPEDITLKKAKLFSKSRVNRFSLGVQSFFEDDLNYLHRLHTKNHSEKVIKLLQDVGLENISIDLMYSMPTLTSEKWKKNLQKIKDYQLPHFSAYSLTVEKNTPLAIAIEKNKACSPKEEDFKKQFFLLLNFSKENNYVHYEISNFSKEDAFGKYNLSCWLGKTYFGIGPSAHSYLGRLRKSNVSNLLEYIKKINLEQLPQLKQDLTTKELFNEYIMTHLRTKWGVSLEKLKVSFGDFFSKYFVSKAIYWVDNEMLFLKENIFILSDLGKCFVDRILLDLFFD